MEKSTTNIRFNQRDMRKVIDADNQKCLEEFYVSHTELMLEKYKSDGRWQDVGVDVDGDIILWEEE